MPLGGCAADPSTLAPEDLPYTKVEPGKEDSSVEAIFLEMDFDAELHTSRQWGAQQQIEEPLPSITPGRPDLPPQRPLVGPPALTRHPEETP